MINQLKENYAFKEHEKNYYEKVWKFCYQKSQI